MKLRMLTCWLLVLCCAGFCAAGDWPQFRGPNGDGIAAESDAPTKWSATENIRWKAKLPRPGNGSPIVVGERVFVTSAKDADGTQRSLYCFDAKGFGRLWVRTVAIDKKLPTQEPNPYCGTTPASDGKRVVVWHASAGLFCYDMDGKELWSREYGEFQHMWGYGSSPILHEGKVILHSGPGKRVFVTSVNLEDGTTVWETDEPLEGRNGASDRNTAGQYMGSWSTPVMTKVNGKDQIIVMLTTRVNAYDPATGEIIWTCDGLRHDRGDLAYSSPIIAGDVCFVTGGFRGPAMAIRLGETGNITGSSRLWRKEQQPQSIGSGVFVDGHIYRPNAGPGTIECIEPVSGEVKWENRGSGGNHWGSIVAAGGLLYATDQQGTTVVFKPNPEKYDEVSRNSLRDRCNTTPAVANRQIVIRTDGHLYCIGE